MTDRPTLPTLRHFAPKHARRRSADTGGLDDLCQSEPRNLTRREQAVWRAVIMQALTDAMSNSRKPYALRCKREALSWLTGNSRDFRTVCDYAGYDPTYLYEKIQRLLQAQRLRCTPAVAQSFSLRAPSISMRLGAGNWTDARLPSSIDEDA